MLFKQNFEQNTYSERFTNLDEMMSIEFSSGDIRYKIEVSFSFPNVYYVDIYFWNVYKEHCLLFRSFKYKSWRSVFNLIESFINEKSDFISIYTWLKSCTYVEVCKELRYLQVSELVEI